jgi:hypothetical protein
MTDPGSSMSPVAILVLTVVVLSLLVGWLAVVFRAARQPGGGSPRPGSGDPARARQPEAVTHHGDMAAGARVHPPAAGPGQPAGDGGTEEPPARRAGQAG